MRKPRITEREFMDQVAEFARLNGWRVAHFRPARTAHGWRTACQFDAAGWPDLLMVRGHVIVAAELKAGKNKVTPEQTAWLLVLGGAGVQARIWRPSDWPEIEATLGR